MEQAKAPFWKTALFAGIPAGVLFGLFQFFFTGQVTNAVIAGLFFAVFFGIGIALFVRSKTVAKQTAIALPPGEVVEYEGGANHWLRGESRGGRLYLTNRHLIFQPHSFNIQGGRIVIPRGEISGAERCMTLGIVPNGIKVKRRDGADDRFVVSGRAEWLRRLASA